MKIRIRLIAIFLAGIFFSLNLLASEPGGNGLIAFRSDEVNMMGYKDQTGNVVIEPVFLEADEFLNGYAVVRDPQTQLYGYIDSNYSQTRNYAMEPQFKSAGSFSEGMAVVEMNEEGDASYGYIDIQTFKRGTYSIEPQFCKAEGFSDGLALACKSDHTNRECICGYIDKNFGWTGEFNIDPIFTVSSRSFREGYASVGVKGKYGSKHGFITKDYSTTNELAIPPVFDWAASFSESKAVVRVERYYGYIDKSYPRSLEFNIKPQFLEASTFSCGLAAVKSRVNNKWGYIDGNFSWSGKYAIEPQYDIAYDFGMFERNIALVCKGKNCHNIDKEGQRVFRILSEKD